MLRHPTFFVNWVLGSELLLTKFSDFLNDFLNIFPTLSKFYKKVFKYLQWFSKKFRCVFPCILRIANSIGCSNSTVKRATAFFEQMGWIIKKKCPYGSNQYFINNELISLNLDDPSLFFREECSQNDPVLGNSSSDLNNLGTQKAIVPIQKKREIPYFIKIKGLSNDDQQRLANEFPDYVLYEAIKDAKAYVGWGNKIKSFIALVWSRAKSYY